MDLPWVYDYMLFYTNHITIHVAALTHYARYNWHTCPIVLNEQSWGFRVPQNWRNGVSKGLNTNASFIRKHGLEWKADCAGMWILKSWGKIYIKQEMYNQGHQTVGLLVWCWFRFNLGNILRFYIIWVVSKYFISNLKYWKLLFFP